MEELYTVPVGLRQSDLIFPSIRVKKQNAYEWCTLCEKRLELGLPYFHIDSCCVFFSFFFTIYHSDTFTVV